VRQGLRPRRSATRVSNGARLPTRRTA